MKRFLLLIFVCTFSATLPLSKLSASPVSREQYLKDTEKSYLPMADAQAKLKEAEVISKIHGGWTHGEDPPFYEGNTLGGISAALIQDSNINMYEDFWDCFDLEIVGICYNDGAPVGLKIEYRWPMQAVHTHGFYQNRYLPKSYFETIKSLDYIEEFYYPLVNDVLTPFLTGRGGFVAWEQLIDRGHHAKKAPDIDEATTNLEQAPERVRYASGSIGTAAHLEYTIVPTLAQVAWTILAEIFPLLNYIPCTPPTQIPLPVTGIPITSEAPTWIALTRNPQLHPLLFKESELQSDMAKWWEDPTACVRYNMAYHQGNIPYDMYKAATESGSSPNPPLFTPMNYLEAQLLYGGMCTENWGPSLPITTIESLHHNDIVHAGINLLKAARLGWGVYLTYMRDSKFPQSSIFGLFQKFDTGNPNSWKFQLPPADKLAFYPVHKKKDRIQFTYHDEVPKKCMHIGDPAPKFPGADQMRKPGEHGMYTATHWKYFRCCMRFF